MKELLENIKRNGNGNGNGRREASSRKENPLLIKDALFVRQEGTLVKVKYEDILWLKGDGNYTTLVTRNFVISVRNILKDFEDALPKDQFMRVHKSYMVRLDEISVISTREVKIEEDMVPVGRTYYQRLIDGIQRLSSE
ncbi:LytTR family DNA-binding domain-containing protein [Algoriphagus sp. NF]|uniref:LytTR family transcriptional regulator n=1 Tax=Algoriphagus marincola TaxID=264027 RepID=A0ABS7N2G4_9BACT|nr:MULTISPECIES: LytTR family DNA-binding domain-containing protein [Algoriphagus]MBY5950517.1 LytTR family transcriptional regulator [Algoriphagus marincola]MCR9081035.1 LytTR family transcriptional regulator [Cyclobacteriaceae bacterium]MDE0559680.1 LytTR family DNA-binding domain-containing protein [Algoriphagus sp. NF]